MINARKELEEVLKEMGKKLQAAAIESNLDYSHSSRKHYLYANYTDAEYEEFMKSLDFEYDNGFGGVLLHGVLWLQTEHIRFAKCTTGANNGLCYKDLGFLRRENF